MYSNSAFDASENTGSECILQCAKERRSLPSRKYTCCMSLEGMRILAIGFDKKKKVRTLKLAPITSIIVLGVRDGILLPDPLYNELKRNLVN